MRGRKPFKFNVTSKRRLVSRKHKDSASPFPSPKRNRSNSRIDKSHGKRSKKGDRDSKVDRSHKKSSEADRARDNNSERSDDRSCMDKSPRNSSEGSDMSASDRSHGKSSEKTDRNISKSTDRGRERSSEKTDRNISKSTDRVRERSSEKTDRNSSIDESSERSSSLGSDESHGRSGGSSKRELSEIHSKVDYLIKEIHDIKKVQVEQAVRLDNHMAVADEIIQILAGLDSSLLLDHTQPWNEIQSHISKDIIPAIDKALKDRIVYNQTELKYVLQQLHRHRRESWQISQNVEKVKEDKKRKGTNSRRSDVKRRKRGLQHMNATNDPIFVYLRPTLLSEKDYKRDIEELVENGAYHSDEISETDEEKAQKEITDHNRPKNKDETDKHVIYVYDKSWRLGKVRKLLRCADGVGESVQHIKIQRKWWYNDRIFKDDSKPLEDAPYWTISSTYKPNQANQEEDQEGSSNPQDPQVLDE
ncbi:unnamed protein product [Rhizophagus irregularis]|uniref:Uncharacterized protein n=1 Tax=Rhizophagus irregularis TaxID=588596 RepID=A0A915YPG2_9GLOM|nr:unnamed protein product [Rhizophagus irregularis]